MATEEQDPPFHFEIWRGPGTAFGDEPKAIYYVENHNGQCGYGELALDFSFAARELIATYRADGAGNWMAPVAHLVRQTLELLLKDLLSSICDRDPSVPKSAIRKHDIAALWDLSARWLVDNDFPLRSDARFADTDHLIAAYHAIDPSGDLFRFGISYQSAYGKAKSYDRVGIILDRFETEFDASLGLLQHWTAAVWRKTLAEEEGWTSDDYFDMSDFPRLAESENGAA